MNKAGSDSQSVGHSGVTGCCTGRVRRLELPTPCPPRLLDRRGSAPWTRRGQPAGAVPRAEVATGNSVNDRPRVWRPRQSECPRRCASRCRRTATVAKVFRLMSSSIRRISSPAPPWDPPARSAASPSTAATSAAPRPPADGLRPRSVPAVAVRHHSALHFSDVATACRREGLLRLPSRTRPSFRWPCRARLHQSGFRRQR